MNGPDADQAPRRRRSIYERYVQPDRRARTWVVRDGWISEVDEKGELHPVPPCCDNPWDCRKDGCWIKLGVVLPDR
jgi:hypothetical protein